MKHVVEVTPCAPQRRSDWPRSSPSDPVLEGKWPEVLGGATVQARVAKDAQVSIELEA